MPVVGSVALAAPHKMSIELFSTVVIVEKSYGELFLLEMQQHAHFGRQNVVQFQKVENL